jgi:ATP-dependent helicase Lhr and Lhr-like helicase
MSCPGNNTELIRLTRMMPDSWPVFFNQRIPRKIQAESMPHIVQGKSVLLSSPTASGKTEAAIAPLYQRHVSFGRTKLGVIYVAPTKALINDLYHRIQAYFCQQTIGLVSRYTGDRHDFAKPEGVFILLCTPEALDSLSLMKSEIIASVRAFVIDEIHLLHGTARGQQLRHVIKRIQGFSNKPKDVRDIIQIIGMSATVDDISNMGKQWIGHDFTYISVGDPRIINTTFLNSNNTISKPKLLQEWVNTTSINKLLVFGNTRNSTHQFAASIHKLIPHKYHIYMHIGILSAIERERVEESMRTNKFGICVATSTLEIGIDIGDIDAVSLINPPSNISSFLQRIGRGNRRTGSCNIICLCQDEQEELIYRALLHCASKGIFDDIHEYVRPSVCFQQVLSLCWHGIRHGYPITRRSIAEHTGGDSHERVIDDMLETGALRDIGGSLIPNDDLMDTGDKRQIHSIILGSKSRMVTDATSGDTVANFEGHGNTEGGLFVAGSIKKLVESANGDFYVEKNSSAVKNHSLARLPSSRGKNGFSRRLMWAIAELQNETPSIWKIRENKLYTWGGLGYNNLLKFYLKLMIPELTLNADDYGLSKFSVDVIIEPVKIKEFAEIFLRSGSVSLDVAAQFRQPSKYFSKLGKDLQKIETLNSVPMNGFITWLNECEN